MREVTRRDCLRSESGSSSIRWPSECFVIVIVIVIVVVMEGRFKRRVITIMSHTAPVCGDEARQRGTVGGTYLLVLRLYKSCFHEGELHHPFFKRPCCPSRSEKELKK
jgi:hypothetical protein